MHALCSTRCVNLLGAVQDPLAQRSIQAVEKRMHDINGSVGVTFASGALAEPVAFRRLAVEAVDSERINSIRVRSELCVFLCSSVGWDVYYFLSRHH